MPRNGTLWTSSCHYICISLMHHHFLKHICLITYAVWTQDCSLKTYRNILRHQVVISADDRAVTANQTHASFSVTASVCACASEICRQSTNLSYLCGREFFLSFEPHKFISHSQEPQFVPHVRIVCYDWASTYQFVKFGVISLEGVQAPQLHQK